MSIEILPDGEAVALRGQREQVGGAQSNGLAVGQDLDAHFCSSLFGRRHEWPSRAMRASAASGPQPPAS